MNCRCVTYDGYRECVALERHLLPLEPPPPAPAPSWDGMHLNGHRIVRIVQKGDPDGHTFRCEICRYHVRVDEQILIQARNPHTELGRQLGYGYAEPCRQISRTPLSYPPVFA